MRSLRVAAAALAALLFVVVALGVWVIRMLAAGLVTLSLLACC